MNVLFLTMVKTDVLQRGIYNDLMRKFRNEGHEVFIVMPVERRDNLPTSYKKENGVHILAVKTLNVQKTNVIEKGLGQVSLEYLFNRAIKKYFKRIKFDLILYSTPPITYTSVISAAKRANPSAKTYLMLKDIFPQNAVDLGMLTKTGLKGLLYKYFRNKEKNLYSLSDTIGCMSPANVKYVLEQNPEIAPAKVEVCPNSVELFNVEDVPDSAILRRYNLPTDKPIFIYGGNLGRPQGIPFLIECLEANKNRTDCHFLIVGTGTHYSALASWYENNKDSSVTVMAGLPKVDYDRLVRSCHVGLVFLDYNFTIPNFPSRLLSYLEYKMPVICATDPVCDMGRIAEDNGFGFWTPSNNVQSFTSTIDKMLASDITEMGKKGYEFLKSHYLVEYSYNAIMSHFE